MNHQTNYQLISCVLACLVAIQSGILRAADDERWYRVELLVFSHKSGNVNETWEPTPTLAYPEPARFLVEPDWLASNQARYDEELALDESGIQYLVQASETASEPDSSATPGDIVGAEQPTKPTAFRVLPASQREFGGKAAYMQRSGRYSTLFHQAWLQPVASRENTRPLVIDRSGDTGEWPLLQGSVTLYLSRYLHLETNLWLNTSGDYLPGTWRMPAPPFGPPSLIIETPVEDPLVATAAGSPQDRNPESDDPDATVAEPDPLSPYRHAVLLQQKRRMRSNEVHYIDHPLLGVVIKLTPLAEEDFDLFAEAEETGDYPPLEP